jgi:hypothetical protein
MTIERAIKEADALCQNKYDNESKYSWLSRLDMMVADEIIRKSEKGKDFKFAGYGKGTPGNTELIVPEPYAEMYIHYIHSKIYLFNQDYERYNTATAAFYSAYQDFAEYYIRENEPPRMGIKVY